MHLATLVEEFLTDLGWVDGIETEEIFDGNVGLRVITKVRITIENQTYRLFINTIEKSQCFMLILYPPYKVNEGKYVDASMLFNYFNNNYLYGGRIAVDDDGTIRYRQIIDVSETEPSKNLIKNMLENGIDMFEQHAEAIALVSLTKKSYEAIREYIEKKAEIEKVKKWMIRSRVDRSKRG